MFTRLVRSFNMTLLLVTEFFHAGAEKGDPRLSCRPERDTRGGKPHLSKCTEVDEALMIIHVIETLTLFDP